MTLLHALCVALAALGAQALPGRVPKVYNALITSGQNLQPSRSYPVYQPIFQEPFGIPLQPAFYYDDDFKGLYPNGLVSAAEAPENFPELTQASDRPIGASGPDNVPALAASTTLAPVPEVAPETSDRSASPASAAPPAPPAPPAPATQPPIPLNEYGLPPAILPLGRPERIRPSFAFDPFADFAPYYPKLDPYSDPYAFRSYPLLPPVYRLTPPHNLAPAPVPPAEAVPAPEPAPAPSSPEPPSSAPPPAPSDLDVKNYTGKDPTIPDVPPPPLPSGGIKE